MGLPIMGGPLVTGILDNKTNSKGECGGQVRAPLRILTLLEQGRIQPGRLEGGGDFSSIWQ